MPLPRNQVVIWLTTLEYLNCSDGFEKSPLASLLGSSQTARSWPAALQACGNHASSLRCLSFPFPLAFPYSTISDISVLKLKVDKCSRQDTVFMKKVVSGSGSSCPFADQCEDCASVFPSHTESCSTMMPLNLGMSLGKASGIQSPSVLHAWAFLDS